MKYVGLNPLRGAVWGVLAIALLLTPGCGTGGYRVDPQTAQDVLKSTLDRWKLGGNIEDPKSQSPPVVVQDSDWQAGAALVDYRVIEEKAENANLRCAVELTVKGTDGKDVTKRVSYLVTTSPNRTVFRELW
jgi:hypothetical protein